MFVKRPIGPQEQEPEVSQGPVLFESMFSKGRIFKLRNRNDLAKRRDLENWMLAFRWAVKKHTIPNEHSHGFTVREAVCATWRSVVVYNQRQRFHWPSPWKLMVQLNSHTTSTYSTSYQSTSRCDTSPAGQRVYQIQFSLHGAVWCFRKSHPIKFDDECHNSSQWNALE